MTSEKEMSFLDHIADLRTCLIRCVWILAIATSICFYFHDDIFHFLWRPYALVVDPENTKINYKGILDPFIFQINLSLVAGIILSLPFILFEAFKFIAPGLKENEVKFFRVLSLFGSILFLLGVFIGYEILLPRLAQIMMDYRQEGTVNYLNAQEFLKTTIKLILGLGLIMQFPIIIYFLVKIDLISVQSLKNNRKIILIIIMIISAIVTPPDPLSLIIISAPFYLLFEATILAANFFIKPED